MRFVSKAAVLMVVASVSASAPASAPVAVGAAVNASGVGHEPTKAASSGPVMRAALQLADGTRVGSVLVSSAGRDGSRVLVSLRVPAGAASGRSFHGFHVHANDNPANGTGCVADPRQPSSTWFVSADGHFTAPGQSHGDHDGDMPAVNLDTSGRAEATFTTDRFTPQAVLGRAVVLHAGPDNFGNVPTGEASTAYRPNSPSATDLTARTGNAGDRVACGVLVRAH